MDLPFDVSYEAVTPALAREFLQRNRANRKLKRSLVESLVRDIRSGRWLVNHQGIAFDTSGDLIDGQHRLTAIVKADAAVKLVIFRNVPATQGEDGTRTMHVVDRGVARTVGDALCMEQGVAEAWLVSAVATSLASQVLQSANRVRRPSIPQVLGVVERFRPHLVHVVKNRSRQPGLKGAVVLAAVALARSVHPEKVDEFYSTLVSGIGLKEGSPALVLRNAILARPHDWRKGGAEQRLDMGNQVLGALHAHVRGSSLAKLSSRVDGAEFFLASLKASVAELEALFPTVGEVHFDAQDRMKPEPPAVPIVDGYSRPKLTPLAESLVRGKEMSEKLESRLSTGNKKP